MRCMTHIGTIVAIVILLVSTFSIHVVNAVSAISIDVGGEWMKIALVKRGVPMDIVLNSESKRKTSFSVSMRNDERLFGESAANLGVRFPSSCFSSMQSLLGLSYENPFIKSFEKMFPQYTLVKDEERNTVRFVANGGDTTYTPEELVAMVFTHAKKLAEISAEEPIRNAVITVPAYYGQFERKAILDAAAMAQLNVLQLMNDNTAVALHYAVKSIDKISSTPSNYVFYDVGASSTSATIVTYSLASVKENGRDVDVPQVEIKATAFDRNLGGRDFDRALLHYFAGKFDEKYKGKAKSPISSSPRSMAKLLKESKRRKEVLSANTDTTAQIEGLHEDIDFSLKITRAEFEELTEDLLTRTMDPVTAVLMKADMSISDIHSVVLTGGGNRIPKIQQMLVDTTGRKDLEKSINGDEAAAMGAVFHAAGLSKMFRVKKFDIRDSLVFPIDVSFEKASTINEETLEQIRPARWVRKTIFHPNNSYPQKKIMTFNKQVTDFSLHVDYGDLSFLNADAASYVPSLNISTIEVSGVEDAIAKYNPDEFRGVKVHFELDSNGLISLVKAEALFEITPPPSATSSILDTMSNFFGSSDTKDSNEDTIAQDDSDKMATDNGDKDAATADQTEEPVQASDSETAHDIKNGTDSDASTEEEKPVNSTLNNDNNSTSTDENKDKVNTEVKTDPEPLKIKEALVIVERSAGIIALNTESLDISRKRLRELEAKDNERAANAAALNDLETFIYTVRDFISMEEIEHISTEEERDTLRMKLSEASDWLFEEGEMSNANACHEQEDLIKAYYSPILLRFNELTQRPKSIKLLNDLLNLTESFIGSERNRTDEERWITDEEVNNIERIVNETTEWLVSRVERQNALASTEDPSLLSRDVNEKGSYLHKQLDRLLKKPKPTPKKAKIPKKNNDKPADDENSAPEDVLPNEDVPNEDVLVDEDTVEMKDNIVTSDDNTTVEAPVEEDQRVEL